jgi:hypothetical protein
LDEDPKNDWLVLTVEVVWTDKLQFGALVLTSGVVF